MLQDRAFVGLRSLDRVHPVHSIPEHLIWPSATRRGCTGKGAGRPPGHTCSLAKTESADS